MEGVLTVKQIRRLERRERIKLRNEPPRLTVREEVFNAVSHGLGALLAAGCLVLLLLRSDTGMEIMASCFYGISMVVMMGMSGVYHAMKSGSAVKRVCRRFDYTSIYLLIGGTFAPIFLLYLGGTVGVVLFCVQWAVILCGVTLMLTLGPGCWRSVHFTLYFLLGWSGVLFLPSFLIRARGLLCFILMGGLAYTLGMIPFVRKRKYDHCVWHLCVLLGAALHFWGIYTRLYA